MLVRVARRLLAWPSVEHLYISIDTPQLLEAIPFIGEAQREGRVTILRSRSSPSQSVIDALEAAEVEAEPVLVTTADHALLDDTILDAFFEPAFASPADLNVGLVSRTIIEQRFPTAKRTYLDFRDDGYSGANLFLFKNRSSREAAAFWRRVENDRKKPWRIAKAFGIGTLVLFMARRLTLENAMERVSGIVGTRVEAIKIPIAEAAVDVESRTGSWYERFSPLVPAPESFDHVGSNSSNAR
jgi:hypothetical protein